MKSILITLISFLSLAVLATQPSVPLISLATPTADDLSGGYIASLEPLENAEFVSTPEQDHQPLIDAMNAARSSIYVGIFGISDIKVAEALSAAQKRGVAVTVICDAYCSTTGKRLEIFNKLKNDGVEIYTSSTAFSISHWKMFVVDEKKAFVSTMNFIIRTGQMRDMGLFFTNAAIIHEIINVFKSDVQNAKNQTALTPLLTNPNLVWSPNNSEAKLASLINSATTTVDIWIENMGSSTIHAALKAAANRGVAVRLLTSECGLGMPRKDSFTHLKDLADAKINVHVMPYPATTDMPYIHAKSITVDHQTVFVGSENFSMNSLNHARELGIIFQNREVEAKMHGLYEKDWSHSKILPTAAPESCNSLTAAI